MLSDPERRFGGTVKPCYAAELEALNGKGSNWSSLPSGETTSSAPDNDRL